MDIVGNAGYVVTFAWKVMSYVFSDEGSFFGRKVKDWSVPTICVLGIVGATTGVIGAIAVSPIFFAISIAAFAAALFLGIYQITQNEKDSGGGIEVLDKILNDSDKSLGDLDQTIENINGNVANLDNTKKELFNQLDEQKDLNAKITNKFEEKIIEFEEISKELNKTVKKLDILEDVSVSIQSIASCPF